MKVWPHRILDAQDDAPAGQVWAREDGSRVWVPEDDRTAPEAFLNHSCDPSLWMADEVTLAARRGIAPFEELTIDYALFELDVAWKSKWRCRCGVARCRTSITGRDFELPELQQRYGRYFHPVLLRGAWPENVVCP